MQSRNDEIESEKLRILETLENANELLAALNQEKNRSEKSLNSQINELKAKIDSASPKGSPQTEELTAKVRKLEEEIQQLLKFHHNTKDALDQRIKETLEENQKLNSTVQELRKKLGENQSSGFSNSQNEKERKSKLADPIQTEILVENEMLRKERDTLSMKIDMTEREKAKSENDLKTLLKSKTKSLEDKIEALTEEKNNLINELNKSLTVLSQVEFLLKEGERSTKNEELARENERLRKDKEMLLSELDECKRDMNLCLESMMKSEKDGANISALEQYVNSLKLEIEKMKFDAQVEKEIKSNYLKRISDLEEFINLLLAENDAYRLDVNKIVIEKASKILELSSSDPEGRESERLLNESIKELLKNNAKHL